MRRRSRRLNLTSDVAGVLPTVVNLIKFAPIVDLARALTAADLPPGDTTCQWDTTDNPKALPEVAEPL